MDSWRTVHGFSAQLIDIGRDDIGTVIEALGSAGCLDVDSDAHVGGVLLAHHDRGPTGIVVVGVHHGDTAALQRLAHGVHPSPVLALCDEADLELAFASGATQCVTRPLRGRELVGRIRESMRSLKERRVVRDRKASETIVALQREKQDLERLVCVDALTGVANRRHAMDLLATEWRRAARDQQALALIMVDLDSYHAYNEQYGHLGGDTCLQRVADAMVRCLRRPSDFLGRYGGEEFMAVLPSTDSVGAKIVAERMRAAVEALGIPHSASACARVVTITAGFSSIKVLPEDSLDRLIAAADAALLQAKAQGRNRVGGVAPLVRPSRVSAQRWERYAPVYVDPWYRERVPTFLDSVREQLASLAESARHGERRSGVTMARLRHTARELGLVAIEVLMRDIEQALREGELPLLRAAADELLQYVLHVQVIYRRPSESAVA